MIAAFSFDLRQGRLFPYKKQPLESSNSCLGTRLCCIQFILSIRENRSLINQPALEKILRHISY